jgi:short-subunit dehydrogenase
MSDAIRDSVVLVTGASSGIGRATAARLAALGAQVTGCARDAERLEATRKEIPSLTVTACDVRDPQQRADLIADVVRRHGRIDALVNNAGVGRIGWFVDLDSADLEDVFATNVVASADLTRLALRQMLDAGHGHVVEIVSVAGWFATPPLTAYAASKHALAGLVQGLRAELRGTGVLVHSINPGPVSTEFPARAAGFEPDEGDDWSRADSPLALDADSVAEAVERCLRATRPQTLAVPPLAAISRLGHVPVVGPAMEHAVASVAGPLVDLGRRIANRRVPPSYQIPSRAPAAVNGER